MRPHPLLPVVLLLAAATASAAQLTLSLFDIEEAVRLGQTRIAADRERFHAPYRIVAGQPPVDYIEVVTPYRRVVIAAEQRALAGERSFGQRQAMQLLTDADGQFDFVVELTFHPLNSFVGMPAYDVVAMKGGERIVSASLTRVPRFGARVDGLPPPIPLPAGLIPNLTAQPILGGTITARFRGSDIDPAAPIDLLLVDQGKPLARVSIDLGRLR
jgi:hypothetical protein